MTLMRTFLALSFVTFALAVPVPPLPAVQGDPALQGLPALQDLPAGPSLPGAPGDSGLLRLIANPLPKEVTDAKRDPAVLGPAPPIYT
ncbi:hypothetical protein EDB86DRAFT_929032 [Lactarius hatsudake]|nr:hypothetical protein EDB86DRAFT_929032 [Lactarius hatsudake]